MADLNTQASIDAIVALLESVAGIGKVEDRPGGVPTWIERARPEQAFWEVDGGPAVETAETFGGTSEVWTIFRIEGFMPWSYANPNTARTWRGLTDTVIATLRPEQTLSGTVAMTGLPQVRAFDRVGVPDGQKEVLCHHILIELRARTRPRYTPR